MSAILIFGLCVFGIGCSAATVQADAKIDPKLEEQVLQIIRNHPEVILESVQEYQKVQRDQQSQSRRAFLKKMIENPASIIGDSPTLGSPAKKIVLVEFSDFQCPFCARAKTTVKQFMEQHKDEVTLTYKHFPLTSIHSEAMPAAEASWAAYQQGKFWEYHDALFDHQDQLGDTFYLETAKTLGLNVEKFKGDRAKAKPAIEKDLAMAEEIGLTGTPVFVMNGEVLTGAVELSELEETLAKVKAS